MSHLDAADEEKALKEITAQRDALLDAATRALAYWDYFFGNAKKLDKSDGAELEVLRAAIAKAKGEG